ncbi:odorant receptor 22c-like [Culicoides brevitarsis]|uniref:odorant receptor 22c-like n=1 Tax=Culicoides brevitarsis TaxID=469753 RepID=UPI00307BD234
MKLPKLFQVPTTEDEIFKFTKFELYYIGAWFYPGSSKFAANIRMMINFFINTISVLAQYSYAYIIRKDLVVLLDCCCPATTMGVTSFKTWILWWRKDELNNIFETIKEALKREIDEKGTWYTIMQLIYNFQHYGEYFEVQLPFKSWWPFNYKQSPMYEIMFVYSFYSGVVTQIMIPACDGLFLDIYLHIGTLFDLLCYDLETVCHGIFVDDEDFSSLQKFTPEQNRAIYKKLSQIMQKHQFIFDLCDRVLKFFREIIFLHIASASLIICMSLMDLILSPGVKKMIYINYISAAVMQVFVYAVAGSHLEEKCLSVGESAFFMPWNRMDGKTRALVQMLIIRGQKPKKIEALIVTASLPSFTSIMQAAGSYVTLLQTFIH